MKSGPSRALVVHDRQLDVFRVAPDWQRIWLTLESESWRSLVVLPTGDLSSIELVRGLAAVAWQQRGTRIIVADLRSIAIAALSAARQELRRHVESGDRVMIATQSLDASPTTATIAREADRALLCVHLNKASLGQVRKAIKELGKQRYLGAIAINQGSG